MRLSMMMALAIVAVAVSAALALPYAATAAPREDGRDRLSVLARPEASLEELEAEARRVRAAVKTLEAELSVATAQWSAARSHLDDVNVRLVAAGRDLERNERELERQRRLVATRMSAMYKAGEPSWMDVVVTSHSMADAEVLIEHLLRIAELDREGEAELARLTAEAERLEKTVVRERAEAIDAQARIEDRRAELDRKLAEREALLKDVVAQIKRILASPEKMMTSGGKVTQLSWAQAFLKRLGMRPTVDNVAAVVAWEMAEGGHWYNGARYNPLNTTQRMPRAGVFNSHGVKIYRSWGQGLEATVITINNGYYGGILAALRAGNDGQAVAAAVAASPWGTHSFSVKKR